MKRSLLRNLALLQHIPREPARIDTATLKRHLENGGYAVPSDRTLQRDLIELAAELPLVCDDRSRPYGWSWKREANALSAPMLPPHAALALKLVEMHLHQLLPVDTREHLETVFRQADQALASIADQHLNAWKDRVRIIPSGITRLPPVLQEGVEAAVYEALLTRKAVKLQYTPSESTSTFEYLAHPLALVGKESIRYLVCLLEGKKGVRYLPLHRARSATLTIQAAREPPGFDIDKYIRAGEFEYPTGGRIKLRMRVSSWVARLLAECRLGENQKINESDPEWPLVTVTVQDTHILHGWLLGFGTDMEVLEPASLRGFLKKEVRALASTYSRRPARKTRASTA